MKVLMFGWEYPPHILGGLGTASFGISEGLHAQGDMEITFCLPRPWGDEDKKAANIIAMNCVPIAWRDVAEDYLKERIGHVMSYPHKAVRLAFPTLQSIHKRNESAGGRSYP